MDKFESLSHTKWACKYHVVFIPKRLLPSMITAAARAAWPTDQGEPIAVAVMAALRDSGIVLPHPTRSSARGSSVQASRLTKQPLRFSPSSTTGRAAGSPPLWSTACWASTSPRPVA